ncbi:restriction endonuclease subunit S [Listeria monocytogenes]|uniref:restriction endonuclease subunit S n=1 Tax=Listeria monocytogenes TaxID=1639 RepID=UPI000D6EEEA0|nr:restriction endonuclease subunit S [Listeria monocytogenes]EAG9321861.1 restriction endonuclease [Listeria monocytogenes]EAG9322024.1 restriction endonuclease [Listeria monocytogenes]PWR35333.1 restriction endonuclease [Listeria monocytogenes]
MSGKINASLNKKLQEVEWGEYKLEDLFEVHTSKSIDKNRLSFSPRGIVFIGRTKENNGVQGRLKEQIFLPNEANTFSVSQVGTIVAQYRDEPWYASQNMFVLKAKDNRLVQQHMYMIALLNKSLSKFTGGYSGYPTQATLKKLKLTLPAKNLKIDFDFMEDFMTELEQARMAKLEEYLSVTGPRDEHLTVEEEQVLNEFDKLEWDEYRIGDLFERIKTKKLPYKADELPKQAMGKYVLPCLTSSFKNQGLNYFAPKEGATILKNVISIPSNSDVYRAYFQSRDFTVLSDAYAIRWKSNELEFTSNQYLFVVPCINKVTDLSIYSYKNKLGGWNVVQNKYIQLPIKDNKIDFTVMETLISALQKLILKDVVQYTDTKVHVAKK